MDSRNGWISQRYGRLAARILMFSLSLVPGGCSAGVPHYVSVDGVWLKGLRVRELRDQDIPRFLSDPNRHDYYVDSAPVNIEKVREEIDVNECYKLNVKGTIVVQRCRPKPVMELSGKTSGAYWSADLGTAAVAGRLKNSAPYRIVLDTGYPDDMAVQGIHIRDNSLRYSPYATHAGELFDGTCFVPELNVGGVSIKNTFAEYSDRQVCGKMLGIPFYREPPKILIGLNLLRRFQYIRLDNITNSYCISNDPFVADDAQDWTPLAFTFSGPSGVDCRRLRMQLPVAGGKLQCEFDTGYPGGLIVRDTQWKTLAPSVARTSLRPSKLRMFGRPVYDCRRGTIRQLDAGGLLFHDVDVVVVSRDCPVGCLIGLQFFKNRLIVLDFGRNVLWVSSQEGATDPVQSAEGPPAVKGR
jgi:hypothetical protein